MNKEFIVLTLERNRRRKVFVNEILYCKAENSYTIVKIINDKEYLVSKPIKHFQEILKSHTFIKIKEVW